MKKMYLVLILFLITSAAAEAAFPFQPDRFIYDEYSGKYFIKEFGSENIYYCWKEDINSDTITTPVKYGDYCTFGSDLAIWEEGQAYYWSAKYVDIASVSLGNNIFRTYAYMDYSPQLEGYPQKVFERLDIDTATRNIYLTDIKNNLIAKCNLKDTTGTVLSVFPAGSEIPLDLTLDMPYLYVAASSLSSDTTKIYKYDTRNSVSTLIFSSTDYHAVTGIAHDTSGNIYISGSNSGDLSGYILQIGGENYSRIKQIVGNIDHPTCVEYIKDQNAIAYAIPNLNKICFTLLDSLRYPEIIYPTDTAHKIPYYFKFKWQPLLGGDAKYDLIASTDGNFEEISARLTGYSACEKRVRLQPNHKYYWRIRAISTNSDTSAWSPIYTFTTGSIGFVSPSFINPLSGKTKIAVRTKFQWTPVDADYYEVKVFKDTTKAPVLFKSGISESNYTFPKPLDVGQKYFWTVRAMSVEGDSSAWGRYSYVHGEYNSIVDSIIPNFVTDSAKPVQPVLRFPADSSKNIAADGSPFVWNYAVGATSYYINISKYETFISPVAFQTSWNDSSYNDSDTLMVTDLEPGHLYFWRVRGINKFGKSDWSDVWTFTTSGDSTSSVASKFLSLPLFPQPAAEFVNLNTSELNLSGNAEIEIFSSLGVKLKQFNEIALPGNGMLEIPLSDLTAGAYFLRITSGKSSFIGKLIKK